MGRYFIIKAAGCRNPVYRDLLHDIGVCTLKKHWDHHSPSTLCVGRIVGSSPNDPQETHRLQSHLQTPSVLSLHK